MKLTKKDLENIASQLPDPPLGKLGQMTLCNDHNNTMVTQKQYDNLCKHCILCLLYEIETLKEELQQHRFRKERYFDHP